MENVKFKSYQILKTEGDLGAGAYGTIYKAICDDILCAAKVMNPALVATGKRVSKHGNGRLMWKAFEKECQILNYLSHPNVVQFFQTWLDVDTGEPVILMELLEESLTHLLERCETNLPFHKEVDICHDIAVALSFLHSNGIVHRELSSNNVLMTKEGQAKVTDIITANIFSKIHSYAGMNLSTVVYLAPEASVNKHRPKVAMDCFSYGVLTLQVITRSYPQPTDETEDLVPVTKGSEEFYFYKKVPEVRRRKSQIKLAPPGHLLLPIILNCLKEEIERPTSKELCASLSLLIKTSDHSESKEENDPARIMTLKDREIADVREKRKKEIFELEQSCEHRVDQAQNEQKKVQEQLTSFREEQTQKVNKMEEEYKLQLSKREVDFEARLKGKEEEFEAKLKVMEKEKFTLRLKSLEKEKEEAKMRHKLAMMDLKERENDLQKLQRRLWETEQLSSTVTRKTESREASDASAHRSTPTKLTLSWRQAVSPAMKPMVREDSECVMCNDTLYIRPATKNRVYAYTPSSNSWKEMPACPYENSTLALINNTLVALGGCYMEVNYVDFIFYLSGEGGKYRWKDAPIHMPTKRCSVMAVNINKFLIIAGGQNEYSSLRCVEVFNTATQVWHIAADLPEALLHSSVTISEGRLYFLGGLTGYNMVEKNILFTCSIKELLLSCHKIGDESVPSLIEAPVNVWKRYKGPPVTQSTCVSLEGQVLSLGGIGDDKKPTTVVYRYSEDTKLWSVVGHMTIPRSCCFAVTLPGSIILVLGGNTKLGRTKSIETGQFDQQLVKQ